FRVVGHRDWKGSGSLILGLEGFR
ncbi:unnamed protein product, partial [Rhizophagus irregularis]